MEAFFKAGKASAVLRMPRACRNERAFGGSWLHETRYAWNDAGKSRAPLERK